MLSLIGKHPRLNDFGLLLKSWNRGNVAALANIRPSFGLEVLFGTTVGRFIVPSILNVHANAYGSGNCRVHVPSQGLYLVESIANSHSPTWISNWSPTDLWCHRGSLWINAAAICLGSGRSIRFSTSLFFAGTLLERNIRVSSQSYFGSAVE